MRHRSSHRTNSAHENTRLLGNLIISGKWIWASYTNEPRKNSLQRFQVTYLNPQGEIKKCLSQSPRTADIAESMSVVS